MGWHTFGQGDPNDALVFGITPPGTDIVTLIPGEGLPRRREQPIDVAGASWDAFVLYSYSAIGRVIVTSDRFVHRREVLIVPTGGRRVLAFVDAFMAARQDGAGAERFLTASAQRQLGGLAVPPALSGRRRSAVLDFQGALPL